jgi:DNA topoisomerase-1
MKVVVVESPSKAVSLGKYLGPDYKVLASYGHIRDLPAKDGSVRPDENFAMSWELADRGSRQVREIAKAVKGAETLVLATDPDREGEAISWHVLETLRAQNALGKAKVERVTFNEVTKQSILKAFGQPRALDQHLIEAYLARRALDYLVGFTLSPLLWRKLPGCRSAGRVQSVALRLISERENEIERFRPQEYWTIEVQLTNTAGQVFVARLSQLNGRKLDKFDLPNEMTAMDAVARIEAGSFAVEKLEPKTVQRTPPPPFTTSTLQQEASRKLGMSATRTMQLAQKLYEGIDVKGETVGLITYMRTDGLYMAEEALTSARSHIEGSYGAPYLPEQARRYKSKAKNAQEAHEAIRPTDFTRTPESIARSLDPDMARLYELIWRRALASQMAPAVMDQTGVDLLNKDGTVGLRATGMIMRFDGYLKLYQEGRDDEADEESRALPPLSLGEAVEKRAVKPDQHFTEPPPRYSEASLVKKMEELGIGRPSTYASIIQVLQERNYVRLEKKRFVPEDRGRLLASFLSNFFPRYVEYDFTAGLENQLDDVSGGEMAWQQLLTDFWQPFKSAVDEASKLTITNILDSLNESLAPLVFPQTEGGGDPRDCPICNDGRLSLKLGKFGAFVGCSNYPGCAFTRPFGAAAGGDDGDGSSLTERDQGFPRTLGNLADGQVVTVNQGPYGFYLQVGENPPKTLDKAEQAAAKPKRVSLPPNADARKIDMNGAEFLLRLPRDVGLHPESQTMITANIGRFGPYLKHQDQFVSLRKDEDLMEIGLNRAVVLIAEAAEKKAANQTVLGQHPKGGDVFIQKSRFGRILTHGKKRIRLNKSDPDPSFETALAMLTPAKAAAKTKAKAAESPTPPAAPAKKTVKRVAKKA